MAEKERPEERNINTNGGNYNENIEGDYIQGDKIILPDNQLTPQEYRNRQALLTKVNNFWVKGVLEKSLHNQVLIELGLEERPDAIINSWNAVLETGESSPQPLPQGKKIIDVFDKIGAGRTLLILGEPGSGKTTTLLELTRDLIACAQQDTKQLIPVVFNLSSWAKKRQKIEDWLTEELGNKYDVPKKIREFLVKEQQLLPLLDGLDEVKAEYRDDCLVAINQFKQDYGSELVVCSRIKDYQSLSHRLIFQSAVYIKLLTLEQICNYLDTLGANFTGIRTLIAKDEVWQGLAESPLMLNIMALAYQGLAIENLPKTGALKERRKQLFNVYIKKVFKRRKTNQLYTNKQVTHWLVWLAKKMVQESQSIFLIEKMQPNLLQVRYQKIAYTVVIFMISLFTLSLNFKIVPLETSNNNNLIKYFNLRYGHLTLLKKLYYRGIAIFLLTALYMFIENNEVVFETVRVFLSPIISLILVWLEVSLFYVLIKKRKTLKNIQRLSLQRLLNKIREKQIYSQYPNEKIFKSLKAMIMSLGMGIVVCPLMILLLFTLLKYTTKSVNNITDVSYFLPIVVYFMIWMILINGGKACIQHFSLRLILYCNNYIPWNYARFLDYAADRILLQKVGGGYIFIHRMLMEHFAEMPLE